MSGKIKIGVAGASGRMGQMLIKSLILDDRFLLAGVLENSGHDWLGLDVGEMTGGKSFGLSVSDDPLEVFSKIQAFIDFTTPSASTRYAHFAAQARCVHVIGTTGFSEKHFQKLSAAARHAVLIRAGNMSLGVNLLSQLAEKVAKALDEDFDVEILETHHRMKVDAPSGTALMLGEAVASGRGKELSKIADRGRDGITGPRKRGDIGFSVARGGDVVGEHDIVFAAPGERIVLRHIATDRNIFVRGALTAAIWGQNQKPGEYDMRDVLGLD